ncbi:MAG: ECF transporter S component [Caldisericia bacterium]|nr:ECF transporter S component [Caldisericia bacterium]
MKKLSIKEITTGAVLIAISIVLGITGLGFIPLPIPVLAGTIFHIPVIIAGILLGPEMGFITGLVFGIFAVQQFGGAFPWFVLIPGRPLIGLTAYYSFTGMKNLLRRIKTINPITVRSVSSCIAGILGSLTNSVATLGLGIIFRVLGGTYLENFQKLVIPAIPSIVAEFILAGIIVPAIVAPLLPLIRRDKK